MTDNGFLGALRAAHQRSETTNLFKDDHCAEILRSEPRLQPARVRRALARRAAWIANKMKQRHPQSNDYLMLFEELKAMVQAAEAYETLFPAAKTVANEEPIG